LNTRENELDRVYTQLRKETSRRREIEEEMGNLREDLKLSMQENQSLRTRQDNNRPGQSTSAAVTASAGPSRS
jgi:septation ring formation regulator EzrA